MNLIILTFKTTSLVFNHFDGKKNRYAQNLKFQPNKHRVIVCINISLQTLTTVTVSCYYESSSLDTFRYNAELYNRFARTG